MAQQVSFQNGLTRNGLNSIVDKAADLIRTAVDYKFILVLLFIKRLNDQRKREKSEVIKKLMKEAGMSSKEAEGEAEKSESFYSVNIPKQFLWDEVTKDVKSLPEKLSTSITEIGKRNKELQGVVDRVDFLEFARNQENRELLRQLVELFNKYDLGAEDAPDIFGDAYEHILMKFAPDKAKEGEIYTPREVIRLLIEILAPKPGQSVYDPCHGSAGMLIISHKYVGEKYGEDEAQKLFLYGQERSPTIYAISCMNLLLHEIRNANVTNGDTLDYPRFADNGKLKQFDIVIANPPWNQDGYGEERLKKADFRDRFSFGYPPNKKGGDWAWVQHMLASATDRGKVGVVIDNGCFFRGGKEKAIRTKIIEKDWIECVILLPEKLFYNTGAPGGIIIFNRNKPKNRVGQTVFINASKEFIQHPDVRRLNSLSSDNIKKIAKSYKDFEEIEGFSKIVDRNAMKTQDDSLNVTLYVAPVEETEHIDIAKEYAELKQLEKRRDSIKEKLEKYLTEISNANR
jgi:type I restriction enzyme M protein